MNNTQVALRWLQRMTTNPELRELSPPAQSLKAINDRLYSFGTHFELARKLPDGVFLLNGDTWGSFTGRHQNIVRSVIDGNPRAKLVDDKWTTERDEAYPRVVIPHSALAAAGIVLNSIKVLDSLDDAMDKQTFRGRLPRWIAAYLDRVNGTISRGVNYDKPIHGPVPLEQHQSWGWRQGALGYAPKTREECLIEWEGIKATYDISRLEDGRWEYTLDLHRLGECVFSCEVVTIDGPRREATFISAWDRQDPGTYFLSELPYPVVSLAEAYEALKPNVVKLAEVEGRQVVRQGDIFAVELEWTTRQIAAMLRPEDMLPGAPHSIKEHITRMAPLLGTNHVATEQVTLPSGAVLARGILWHKPAFRDPDHRRQYLGKKWHVIAKNTVPVLDRGAA
jgi:hypothetical protein